MKNIITVILATFSMAIAHSQEELDCEKFKDGKFEILDEKMGSTIIERDGSRQVEYGEGSGLKLKFKVKWLDDCTYTLQIEKVIENPNNYELSKDMILTVEIIETKENSYIQRSSSNFSDMVIESEMVKID